MAPSCTSCSPSVGKMPTITRWLPTERALASAAFRLARSSVSSCPSASPSSCRGGTLISRLNCATSVAQAGSAIALSTSSLCIEGMPRSSTRFSSISWPTVDGFSSNSRSRSIRAKTSSERRTLSRYLRRSSPLILMAWMSRPIEVSAQRVNRTYAPPAGFLTHSHAAGPGASRDSGGRQPGGLVPDPQAEEPAQVRDELVVLVRRVNRLDRLDQQLVEGRAGHPVQHDVVRQRLLGRPEVLVTRGIEVGIGQHTVAVQLLRVGQPGLVRDREILVRLQVQLGPPPRHQREHAPLDQRLQRPGEIVVQA